MHTFILLATIIYAWKYFGQCTLEFNISLHHIRLNLNRFQSWRDSLYVILISVFQVVSLYNMDECRFALFSTSCTHYHNGHTCFYSCPGCISSGRVNLGHFLAVQMCFILHRFYIPRLLSLSHVPLGCEKWFGTAGAQSKIVQWKEMKLVFVRQTRVPAVKVRLELTAGVEYICLRQRVKLCFVWCWPNWC